MLRKLIPTAFLALSLAPAASVAGEIYRARHGQVIGCQNSEAVAAIARLQQQQPVDAQRLRIAVDRGHCITIPDSVTLVVEAREPSPAGMVALVRVADMTGPQAGIGRLWVISNDLDLAGMSKR